jgi:hypothetical protein
VVAMTGGGADFALANGFKSSANQGPAPGMAGSELEEFAAPGGGTYFEAYAISSGTTFNWMHDQH